MARVSYIMASYNHERFVEQMVGSVLSQTYSDIELIIVDDGSTDRTPSVLRSLADTDRRIQLVVQQNQGIVAARNRGLSLSSGEFLSFIDSDDLLPSERTERLVAALDANPEAALAYGDAILIDEHGREGRRFSELHPPLKGEFASTLFSHYCFVPALTVMVRRSSFDRSGPLWGAGPTTDYLKWIELGLYGSAVRLEGEPLGYWRQHTQNLSRASGMKRARQYLELQHDLAALLQKYPEFAAGLDPAHVQRRYAQCYFLAGFYFTQARQWEQATDAFQEAHTLAPRLLYRSAAIVAQSPFRSLMAVACELRARQSV